VKNVRSGSPPGPDAEGRIVSSVALWAVAQQDRLQLFVGPVGLPEHQVRMHKAGSGKMKKSTLICAGIDTGKSKLDVAIDGHAGCLQVDNDPNGHAVLVAWRACSPADRHRSQRWLRTHHCCQAADGRIRGHRLPAKAGARLCHGPPAKAQQRYHGCSAHCDLHCRG
jgi:hypothetical protein